MSHCSANWFVITSALNSSRCNAQNYSEQKCFPNHANASVMCCLIRCALPLSLSKLHFLHIQRQNKFHSV